MTMIPSGDKEKAEIRTVQWIVDKHSASLETSPDLINPGVIESHPLRLSANKLAWLSALPEISSGDILPCPHRVDAPASASSEEQEVEGFAKNGTGGRGTNIPATTEEKDDWAEEEDDGREGEGEPEADVLWRA